MPPFTRLTKAAADRKKHQFSVLPTITASYERLTVVGLCVALLMLTLWTFFGEVEYRVKFQGVLIKSGERYEVISLETGFLTHVAMSDGQLISAGEELARLSLPDLDRKIALLRKEYNFSRDEHSEAMVDSPVPPFDLTALAAAMSALEVQRSVRSIIIAPTNGEVMTAHVETGDFVAAGTSVARIRRTTTEDGGEDSIQAVFAVAPATAERLLMGSSASIEVEVNGTPHNVPGTVTLISKTSFPEWLVSLLPATSIGAYRVSVELKNTLDPDIVHGKECVVRILVDEGTPFSILLRGLV
ncbi:MAG: HlyD family efflux transporter periplasmic adaptor subunit [Aestuariivita sp.]|nr:HlyD family efflux transporter periplasmic adaptor subunit [Aestuariivita sp.]